MAEQASSRRRSIWPLIVVPLVIGLAVVGFFLVRDISAHSKPMPEFPSLADAPDPSLHGTVAYFAHDKTGQEVGCVRLVAASGAASKDVLCLTGADFETGPQLAFLPDGRLQVTMFRWPTGQPLTAGWQKIVDVRTGAVEDVPADQVPSAPSPAGPTVTPSGETVVATAEGGRAEIVVTDAAGSPRSLLSADVGPEYSIRAIFAPNGEWVLAYDGRLLVVTVDNPAVTRVLVEEAGGLGGYAGTDVPLALFAATDADLLTEG
jgi:hypothetical protein